MSQNFAKEDVVKVAKGAGATLVGASVGKGLFLLSHIIIARLLGVEAFGLYALGYAAVKICDILARLGLDTGGMRFISIYKNEDAPRLKGTLLAATTISVSAGMMLSALLYVASSLLAEKLFHKPELTSTLQQFSLAIPLVSRDNGDLRTSARISYHQVHGLHPRTRPARGQYFADRHFLFTGTGTARRDLRLYRTPFGGLARRFTICYQALSTAFQ